jgi:ABC-type lipoprotein release transport system permease subunit
MLATCDDAGFAKLQDLINNATIGQAIHVTREVEHLNELTGHGQRLGLLMSAMILGLGALAVAGIMITRFDARLGQLAVLRALGYGKKELGLCLLWEGLLLGGTAAAVGAMLDALVFPWLRATSQGLLPLDGHLAIPLRISAPVWLAATIATALAACLPLVRLYRRDAHRALSAH